MTRLRSRLLRVGLLVAVVAGGLGVVRPDAGVAAPDQFVTMSDGIEIAVNVRPPDNYIAGQEYPTVFEMSGYDGGSAEDGTLSKDIANQTGATFLPLQEDSRQLTRMFNGDYFTVHASARGTGCSGGEFDLFSYRAALDGKEIIDDWIAEQPWSNGDVAIMGHSYGGITGFMVASTQPDHLRAVTVSGLIDDLYRGIVYPGGVSNFGFPLLWTGGVRPAYDYLGGLAPGLVRDEQADDTPNRRQRCAQAASTKRRTVLQDPIVNGVNDLDGPWWHVRALLSYVHKIDVPIHIAGTYQDEQTGPRGFTHLWEKVAGVPKRLVVSNGDHGTNQGVDIMADRKQWIDHWIRGIDGGFGTLEADATSVRTMFETAGGVAGANKHSATYPLEDTAWTDWHLRAGGGLTTAAPGAAEGSDSYVSLSPGRQSWNYQAGPTAGSQLTTPAGPDEVTYLSEPVTEPTAIAGPMTARLFVSTTAPDTELFVSVVDRGPDGSTTYLQRGMLRASHRAVNDGMSDHTADGRIYRPYRPHSNAVNVTPGEVVEYLVEVFPVGHVFRPGHRIGVKVHAPPAVDSYYVYVPRRAPAVNTILHDAAHPSSIMLPMVPLTGVTLGAEKPCGTQEAVRCIK